VLCAHGHDLDRPDTDQRIGEVPAVAAVQPGGELPAPGAIRRTGTDPGRQPHTTRPVSDIVEHDVTEVRQQLSDKIT
jgi:hypothetical protein